MADGKTLGKWSDEARRWTLLQVLTGPYFADSGVRSSGNAHHCLRRIEVLWALHFCCTQRHLLLDEVVGQLLRLITWAQRYDCA